MKVKELIQHLRQVDETLEVLVNGYEDGIEPLDGERIEKIKYNKNVHGEWYYGEHKKDENGIHEGILIRRKTSKEKE